MPELFAQVSRCCRGVPARVLNAWRLRDCCPERRVAAAGGVHTTGSDRSLSIPGYHCGRNGVVLIQSILDGTFLFSRPDAWRNGTDLSSLFLRIVGSHPGCHRALQQGEPDSLLASHGVYVDYAPAAALAVLQRRKVLTWSSGYKDFMHYFNVPRSPDALVRGISESAWLTRSATPLTSEEELRLDEYLHARYFSKNSRDIAFHAPPQSRAQLKEKLGIRNNNPVFCLFAHVNWDALFEVADMIFPTGNDWVIESIRRMIELKDVNWIVRVHPSENSIGSLVNVGDLVSRTFPSLPDHVKFLRHDAEINSYGLFQLIDGGITICGTIGVELAVLGKPVVIAGGGHYSHKGFSLDASSREQYFALLRNCKDLKPLTASQQELARRYAYSFLIERQIPLRFSEGHYGELEMDRLPDLVPGANPVLDMLCDRIADGRDVVLSPSMVKSAPAKLSKTRSPAVESLPTQALPSQAGNSVSGRQLQLEAFGRFETKDWAGALQLFDKALALQTSQGIHLMRARCLLSLQQPTQAREAVEAELNLNPNHPDALQMLRELSAAQGDCQSKPISLTRSAIRRFSIAVPVMEFATSTISPIQECSTLRPAAFRVVGRPWRPRIHF